MRLNTHDRDTRREMREGRRINEGANRVPVLHSPFSILQLLFSASSVSLWFIFILLLLTSSLHAADAKQALFERVFGDAVKLDSAMVAKTRAAKPNEKVLVDVDGDGKHDEAWFIDANARHSDALRPILVRAIDEDGDLDAWQGPDLDSDLYIVDYHADGVVDVALDYQDNDKDNDVDEMAFYFFMEHHPFFGDNVLRVWWGRDDGDDNLLWYDEDYTYYQSRCQYRCHFSGDETFVAFGLTADSTEWLSAFENPFLFYDLDGDRCSEVVLRIEGKADAIQAIRYSFDADNDAFGQRTHDYDFSITAYADSDKLVTIPPELLESTRLRGIPTQGWLKRDEARRFVENAAWSRAMLTWDEINANTEENVQRDPHERWEGVIAHGNDEFKQVGGPPCSVFNKRCELSLHPEPPLRVYMASDGRLHLAGADKGWLDIDYNFDGKLDAKYTWQDRDGNGRLDQMQIDVDGDGTVDLEDEMMSSNPGGLDFSPDGLDEMRFMFMEHPLEKQSFIDAASNYLPDAQDDPVRRFFIADLDGWMPDTQLGQRIRQTPAGARFYMDLVGFRLLHRLDQRFAAEDWWPAVRGSYLKAEFLWDPYDEAVATLKQHAPAGAATRPDATESFPKRITLSVRPGPQRDRWPICVPLARLREVAPDFNPDNMAVVAPGKWLAWREVPHQIDQASATGESELTFLADLPGGYVLASSTDYMICYSPQGKREPAFPRRTGTAEDWVPPNIGWESGRCAYRAYWGQFDFFGKKTDQLIYEHIGNKSYHSEVEWGIDALHVGAASGIGGLTLYDGDKAYLVQNPAGKGDVQFTKRQLVAGPVRAVIEIRASHIIPDKPDVAVQILCTIYADRQESQIDARIIGGTKDMLLAPGLVKLPREQFFVETSRSFMGTWGWQEEVIGDIGMAIIAARRRIVDVVELPDERRMRCRLDKSGSLRYWIIGDWRRGRQHPIAPTVDNWRQEVGELTQQLRAPTRVDVSRAEPAGTSQAN